MSSPEYDEITQNGEFVDSLSHYSRYYMGDETIVWVCDDCQEVHADPYEQDCACYEGDHHAS